MDGIDASPTVILGMSGDSINVISTTFFLPLSLRAPLRYAAAIQPAEPPPTITNRLILIK